MSAADSETYNAMIAEVIRLASDSIVGLKADGPRYQREQLQIGMVAPDIEGRDADGTDLKLSSYLGQVVVLTFWGFW